MISVQSIEARVTVLHDLTARLMKKIEERAADPAMQNVPGGSTGLIVRTQTTTGEGEGARTIVAYEIDVGDEEFKQFEEASFHSVMIFLFTDGTTMFLAEQLASMVE